MKLLHCTLDKHAFVCRPPCYACTHIPQRGRSAAKIGTAAAATGSTVAGTAAYFPVVVRGMRKNILICSLLHAAATPAAAAAAATATAGSETAAAITVSAAAITVAAAATAVVAVLSAVVRPLWQEGDSDRVFTVARDRQGGCSAL